jgi:hypothetical protein
MKNFTLYFTLIDQRAYEKITNKLRPIPVAAHLTHFCGGFQNNSLKDILILFIFWIF